MVGAAALRYPPKFMADGSSTVSLCTFDFIDFSTKGFSTKRVNKISSTKPNGAIAKVAFQEAGTPFFCTIITNVFTIFCYHFTQTFESRTYFFDFLFFTDLEF